MNEKLLSKESMELLKQFSNGYTQPISSNKHDTCIDQLLDYGLIESHITDYSDDFPPRPVFSDYHITEYGKGYLHSNQQNEIFLNSVIQQAEAAKSSAETAKESSDSSTKYSKISIAISIFALIVSIVAILVQLFV